jgi:putative serine protease PepD
MAIWSNQPPRTPPTGSQPGGWGVPPTPPPPPPPAPPSPPSPSGGGWRAVLVAFALVLLLSAGYVIRGVVDDGEPAASPTTSVAGTTPVSLPSGPTATLDSPGDEPIAEVASALGPAVVQIQVRSAQGAGVGSGVIYDERGLVMTNAHVVGSAGQVSVRLADGSLREGSVVGLDRATDIAVVEIEGGELPVAPLATGDPIVGQTAVALGSPFGLDQTVTAGIVSAVDRPVPNDQGIAVNMLQTDAPINPGNSGGALANRRGEVIGINTAIFSQSGENNGIGFAISIRTAKDVADKIVAGESLEKGALGIQGARTSTDEPGAIVEEVVAGGPAERAGMRRGDRIVAVDGSVVRSFEELQGRIGTYSPGERVTVEAVRDGETLAVEVELGARS